MISDDRWPVLTIYLWHIFYSFQYACYNVLQSEHIYFQSWMELLGKALSHYATFIICIFLFDFCRFVSLFNEGLITLFRISVVVKDATSLCENASVVDTLFIPAGFNTSFDWHERKVKRQSCSRRDTHPSRTMAVAKWQHGCWWFKIPLHWPYCWTRHLLSTKGSVPGAVNLFVLDRVKRQKKIQIWVHVFETFIYKN